MVAAVSAEEIRPEAAASEPTHWLYGRYFLPLPDVSDETRQAINKGRAMPTWVEIITRLRRMERQAADRKADPDEQARAQARQRAAVTGRIEGLGVNGLAAAIGCSHTTALRHLRHLEALGLIRTEQGEFTTELDEATGRIKRNYAKAPPKVIIVTIEDRHCRPCRAPRSAQGNTPGTGPKASGGTPETIRKAPESQDRNWRHSKERTSKEVRSFGTNRRRTAAGPLERPAAAAAKAESKPPAAPPATPSAPIRTRRILRDESGQPITPPRRDWEREAEIERARKERQARVSLYAKGLAMSEFEIIALWQAAPKELERLVTEAGLHQRTPGLRAAILDRLLARGGPVEPPALCLTAEEEAARKSALEALQRQAEEDSRKKAEEAAEWDRHMAEVRRRQEERERAREDQLCYAASAEPDSSSSSA